MDRRSYVPAPIDTADVVLSPELVALAERLAMNTHDVWARSRRDEGWTYGPQRNDDRKEHPGLVPYDDLSESEKDYDRRTTIETLKVIVKLGFQIRSPSP